LFIPRENRTFQGYAELPTESRKGGLVIYRIPVQHWIHRLLNQFATLIHLKISTPRKLTFWMNGSVLGMIGGLLDELHLGSGSHCRSMFQIELDASFLSRSLPASFPPKLPVYLRKTVICTSQWVPGFWRRQGNTVHRVVRP
jgi:hypothetical protein